MSGDFESLAATLTEELNLTRRLLDLTKDARAAAVAADPLLLAQIVTEQEEVSGRLEAAEDRRCAAARELAAGLGLGGPAGPKLEAFAERAPAETAARLRSLGARLRRTALELREASAHNRALLDISLAQVEGLVETLASARAGAPASYGAGGALRPSGAALLMDRKV
jgi:hypothetical protein